MKQTMLPIFLVCLILGAFSSVQAARAYLNPGKWEITTTISMPMMPQPQTVTDTQCIDEQKAKQDPLADMIKQSNCRILKRSRQGSHIFFEVECSQNGVTTRGKGEFLLNGDTTSGQMEVKMNMGNMGPEMQAMMPGGEFSVKTSWHGKRLGPCD